VLSGGMLQDAVDDAGSVEASRYREPPGHSGGLESPDLLHPPDVQLQVRPAGGQRVKAAPGAPGKVQRRSDSARSREEPLKQAR
jgi:hypothetical protein